MGVIGFDHPVIQSDFDVVENHYKYKGKQYAVATEMCEADMIFVNEDLFAQYSVKSPSAYYEEGIWNWENFEKCASELTRDTNGDSVNDVFGYEGWDGNFVIAAAGGELIHLNDDGTLEVTLDSNATLQGMDNYANIYGRLKVVGKGLWKQGKCGMIAWMPRNEYNNIIGKDTEKYTFKWSMVPYPLDERTNTNNIRSCKSYATAIASTTDNPQGCLNYVIASKLYSEEHHSPSYLDYELAFTEEQRQMIKDCSRQAVIPIYQGVGNLWGSQWDFWGMMGRGVTASEVVTTYKPMFEAQVALENSNATY